MARPAREHYDTMRRYRLLAIVLGYLVLYTPPVLGCRYNVREVGFIDLGTETYRLFVYLPQGVPPAEVTRLKETAGAALADSNVRFEAVAADADANHPAMEFLTIHRLTDLPAAVLVSPDGQSMPLKLALPGGSLAETVASALDYVLHSPIRQQILEKSADSYGVVFLIEGPKQERNIQAREVISTAIGRIREQLDLLPKPIARPPEVVTLDSQLLDREGLLLWSLGLKPQDINEPHAAVFYGRGRWIGPLFKGARLTADPLTDLLLVVGSDCECSLDHRFLQGTMLPARWDETLQQRVAQSVGFDPEDPLVKMEMVSIVRRGMGESGEVSMPLGYREIEVGSETTEDAVPAGESSAMNPQSAIRNPQLTTVLAVSLGGMAGLVAIASAVIILRAKRK